MAVLAGDALLNLAFETASSAFSRTKNEEELRRAARAMQILSAKSGIGGMVGGQCADTQAEEFPPEFYEELNGGISLLPEAKEDPEGEPGELYIMGEYCNDMMGKYINLYYGSFAALARLEDWTEEDWEDELYTTLAHEFTHHIEGRAGERGLEIKDEQFMEEFRAGREE